MKFKIDRSNWKKVRLGDVATEYSKRINNPSKSEFDRFVGSSNIGQWDFRIQSWESTDSVTSAMKLFEPNDYLLVRRSLYASDFRERAPRATFSGVCSGDILTIKENPKKVVDGFLIGILNSPSLWKYVVANASGSITRRIKWKDLANYEFLLPPKDQQAKLAELLWAMDEVIEKEVLVADAIMNTLHVQIEKEIHGTSILGKTINQILEEVNQNMKLIELKKLGELIKGKGIQKSDVMEEGNPCVRYGELYTLHNRIIRKYGSFISEELKDTALKLKKHDVLFAGSGETITEIGKSAAFIDDIEAYAGSDILVFRPNDMDGTYLGYLMNSQLVRQQLNKYGTGATVMHIYNSDLAKIKVPKITRKKQELIGAKLELLSKSLFDVKENIKNSKALQKSLINQIF